MIIDSLILHDFGVYAGYQEINLTPASAEKPIIVFGGMNGTGKTTLLDALLLSLFGPAANSKWGGGGGGYMVFLERIINKHSRHKEASVGIDFRHTVNGKDTRYSLRRNWRKAGKGIAEEFTVQVDSTPSPSIARNWLNHIEEILPANIANLFFFDGEQAEEYASAENSAALVETAILNLLGLDIVNQLAKDLRILERRIKTGSLAEQQQAEVGYLQKTMEKLLADIENCETRRAELNTRRLDSCKHQLETLEAKFKKAGGQLYERKALIEEKAGRAAEELAENERSLRELADGCLPLALLKDLLVSLKGRDVREQKSLHAATALQGMKEFSAALTGHMESCKIDKSAMNQVGSYMREYLEGLRSKTGASIDNPIDADTRLDISVLLEDRLHSSLEQASELVAKHARLAQEREESNLEWESIPKPEDMAELLAERASLQKNIKEAEKNVAEITGQIDGARQEIARHEANLQAILGERAQQQIELEENKRVVSHSSKARDILLLFKNAVIQEHISRIQELVLDSYQSLLRKKALVDAVVINPETFQVTLFDRDRNIVKPEQLSAGERQLLAISLVWGMAKASGRALPTVIDTPLGRLDSSHRNLLIQRYFPCASHQVILFSTDEELIGKYLNDLHKWIGKSYLLNHDDQTGTTRIEQGYLQ